MAESSTFRVLTSYYRPKPGGLCKKLFQAIEALLDAGGEVHYLAVTPFPISNPRCHFHRYPWPVAKADGFLFWAVFHVFAPLMLLYLGFRYRITHTFAFNTTYAYALQLTRLVKGIPLALFLRADIQEHHAIKNRATWLLKLEKILEGLAVVGANVYTVSGTLRRNVEGRHRILRPKLVRKFANNIEHRRMTIRPTQKRSETLRLGCVGTFDRVKNHAFALECIAQLKSKDVHLSLYGAGIEDATLRKLAAHLGIDDNVCFMGWIEEPEAIWTNIDLLLFPSISEGSPNAVLEALSYGVPVIASDIPALRELLPSGALLPPGDVTSWTRRLLEIAKHENKYLAKLLQEEQDAVEHLHFDWRAMVRHLILNDQVSLPVQH